MIWSTTPLAIQWSAEGAGFSFAVLARMTIGVLSAATVLLIARIGFPVHRRALLSYLVGGLSLFGAMELTYWSATQIPSGLISVLFGLSPLITGALASLMLRERAFSPNRLAGMVLGVAGLAVIFLHGEGSGSGATSSGLAALLLAVLVYSTGLVLIKRIDDNSPPMATTVGTLAVGLPLFALVWLLSDGDVPVALDLRSGGAIVYLGVFGSVIGFALYYHVIQRMETGKVALITLITPVIALLLGRLLNGERVAAQVWLGVAVILAGLLLHQWPDVAKAIVRKR